MEIKEIYSAYRSCPAGLCTDSRKVTEGCFFVALKGESFDGNAFALQALSQGASYALADDPSLAEADGRIILVENSLRALQELAAFHMAETLKDLPVIGLTGTNGKTTTKELIKAVLSKKYRVGATAGNFNNSLGVPLTVLGFTPDLEIGIVEMGASHPGDIDELTPISQPDFGLITNCGRAHLLGFGSFEGVQKTKGELYDYLKAHGGKVFYNEDDEILCRMVSEREIAVAHPYSTSYEVYPTAALAFDYKGRRVQTRLIGGYNLPNAVAALEIGLYFGVPVEDCIAALEEYVPSLGRSEYRHTGKNELIVDAYNANPSSMSVALDNFGAIETKAEKVVLLGEMRELGEFSEREHVAIVEKVAQMGLKACFVGDEFAKAVAHLQYNYPVFPTSQDLAEAISADFRFENCLLLVKGSRGTKMENTFEAL